MITLAVALFAALGCAEGEGSVTRPGPDGAGGGDPIAQGGPMGSATETNVSPIRCEKSEDCPSGRECVRNSPDDPAGSCLLAGENTADDDAGLGR